MRFGLDIRLRRDHLLGMMFVLTVASAWILLVARAGRPIGRRIPVQKDRVEITAERIDPNSASAASLRRLPGVGVARAQAIVEFRTDGAVFFTPSDLEIIPGIGPGTAGRIAPYLCFPASSEAPPAPASMPAGVPDRQPSG